MRLGNSTKSGGCPAAEGKGGRKASPGLRSPNLELTGCQQADPMAIQGRAGLPSCCTPTPPPLPAPLPTVLLLPARQQRLLSYP